MWVMNLLAINLFFYPTAESELCFKGPSDCCPCYVKRLKKYLLIYRLRTFNSCLVKILVNFKR